MTYGGGWLGGAALAGGVPTGIPLALVDAKGDLIVATGPDAVARRPVGSNDQALVADSSQADGVRWATLTSPNDRDNGQAGMYAPSCPIVNTSLVALTANRAYVQRFVPSRAMSVISLAFVVSTASGTDDPCDVGIYDASGAKIQTSGATTGKLNSTGVKVITIPTVALVANTVYYAALAANSTATLVFAGVANFDAATIFGGAMPQIEIGQKAASYPLPASLSGPTATANGPLLALRES